MVVGPNTRENCLAERTTIFIKKERKKERTTIYREKNCTGTVHTCHVWTSSRDLGAWRQGAGRLTSPRAAILALGGRSSQLITCRDLGAWRQGANRLTSPRAEILALEGRSSRLITCRDLDA
jgi:hypothetical protein